MFDVIASDDGSGIAFFNYDGKTCDSVDMDVRVDDTVELMCEGVAVEVLVTEIASDSILGLITKLPFGADFEEELGAVVNFSKEHISACTHP